MMRNKTNENRAKYTVANLALAVVIELDTGPGGEVRVGVAAEFGLQRSPGGTVRQLLKVIQGCLCPNLSWGTGLGILRKHTNYS